MLANVFRGILPFTERKQSIVQNSEKARQFKYHNSTSSASGGTYVVQGSKVCVRSSPIYGAGGKAIHMKGAQLQCGVLQTDVVNPNLTDKCSFKLISGKEGASVGKAEEGAARDGNGAVASACHAEEERKEQKASLGGEVIDLVHLGMFSLTLSLLFSFITLFLSLTSLSLSLSPHISLSLYLSPFSLPISYLSLPISLSPYLSPFSPCITLSLSLTSLSLYHSLPISHFSLPISLSLSLTSLSLYHSPYLSLLSPYITLPISHFSLPISLSLSLTSLSLYHSPYITSLSLLPISLNPYLSLLSPYITLSLSHLSLSPYITLSLSLTSLSLYHSLFISPYITLSLSLNSLSLYLSLPISQLPLPVSLSPYLLTLSPCIYLSLYLNSLSLYLSLSLSLFLKLINLLALHCSHGELHVMRGEVFHSLMASMSDHSIASSKWIHAQTRTNRSNIL